jgi:hypothetical protein
MRNRSRVILGLVIIGLGLSSLLRALFDVNVWIYCWPIGLIVVGAWLLLRPSMAGPGTQVRVHPLGGVRRSGAWAVGDEEIWVGVGDVQLDLSEAAIAPGESTIKVFGLVGELRLMVPEDAPVAVSSWAILTDGRVYGEKQESWFTAVDVKNDAYDSAEARIKVESFALVSELRVTRP